MKQSDCRRPDEGAQRATFIEDNRHVWNLWVTRDTESDHHKDVARYRATGSSLRPIERNALGDVAGKTLLHLQCNLGSETLSWARFGALATGVDIADKAIAYARALAEEGGLSPVASFIRSDIYKLPNVLTERFDIVIATYGALCWAPDVEAWARVAATFLAPGGIFLLVDLHPVGGMMTADPDDAQGLRLRVTGSYFHSALPLTTSRPGEPPVHAWAYSVGEVVSALIAAGMRIEAMNEYPFAHWRQFPQLVERGDGYWRWPDTSNTLPLLFSIIARG